MFLLQSIQNALQFRHYILSEMFHQYLVFLKLQKYVDIA